jgi:hypothetical protein
MPTEFSGKSGDLVAIVAYSDEDDDMEVVAVRPINNLRNR